MFGSDILKKSMELTVRIISSEVKEPEVQTYRLYFWPSTELSKQSKQHSVDIDITQVDETSQISILLRKNK